MKDIKKHLRHGDYVKIGIAVGVSGNYARKLLLRKTAKRHTEVVAVAERIADLNQSLGA